MLKKILLKVVNIRFHAHEYWETFLSPKAFLRNKSKYFTLINVITARFMDYEPAYVTFHTHFMFSRYILEMPRS